MVTLVALVVSAILLWLVEDAKRTAQRTYQQADCTNIEDVDNKDLVVRDVFWRDFNLTTGNTGRLECYCLGRFDINSPQSILEEEFSVPSSDGLFAGRDTLCQGWAETYFTVQGLIYGGALLVLAANVALRLVLHSLVSVERLRSRTAELVSSSIKLWGIMFLNTAALVVLINARIQTSFIFLRQGEHEDFDADWYTSVGLSITITMALNVFVPHLTPLLDIMFITYSRCRDRSCSCDPKLTHTLSQSELNQLWMGPQMLLDERFAQMFNILFVCMAFSVGVPLLLPICFCSFFLCYWVDKFLFVYVYATPPAYDSQLR